MNWSTLCQDDISRYKNVCNELLILIDILSYSACTCSDLSCKSEDHHKQIDALYSAIIRCLQMASGQELVKNSPRKRNHKQNVIGWNDYVRDAHEAARDAFLMWHANGKPRQGPMFNIMKRTRALFKYALR